MHSTAHFVLCCGLRAAWTLPLLISNITLDMRSYIFCWNVPVQMQFYLLFPLVVLSLRPHAPRFRQRLAWACITAILAATFYRIAVVLVFGIQAQLPIGAHSHAPSHHPTSVAAAWGFLDWLYSSFVGRMTDFALGILVYLIASSPRACQALSRWRWLCTFASVLVATFVVSTSLADSDIRPRPGEDTPLAARLGIQVMAFGIVIPMTMAWAILYLVVQPDLPSRWVAIMAGSKAGDFLAARTYSVFLLHPLVIFGLFQLVPVTSWFGPLEAFSTYCIISGLAITISFASAWLQDSLLEKLTGAAGMRTKSSVATTFKVA